MNLAEINEKSIGLYVQWLKGTSDGSWELRKQGPMRTALVCVDVKRDVHLIGQTALIEYTAPNGDKTVRLDGKLQEKYTGKYTGAFSQKEMTDIADAFGGISKADANYVFVEGIVLPLAAIYEGQWYINPVVLEEFRKIATTVEASNTAMEPLVNYGISFKTKLSDPFYTVITVPAITNDAAIKQIEQMLIEKYLINGSVFILGINKL